MSILNTPSEIEGISIKENCNDSKDSDPAIKNCRVLIECTKENIDQPIEFKEPFKIYDRFSSTDSDFKYNVNIEFLFDGKNKEFKFNKNFFDLDSLKINNNNYFLNIEIKNAKVSSLESILSKDIDDVNYNYIIYLDNVEFTNGITPYDQEEIEKSDKIIKIILLNNVKINEKDIIRRELFSKKSKEKLFTGKKIQDIIINMVLQKYLTYKSKKKHIKNITSCYNI